MLCRNKPSGYLIAYANARLFAHSKEGKRKRGGEMSRRTWELIGCEKSVEE